jgi:hypothetical protein
MNKIELRLSKPSPLNNELVGINRFVYKKLRKTLAWEIQGELLKAGWRSHMPPMGYGWLMELSAQSSS